MVTVFVWGFFSVIGVCPGFPLNRIADAHFSGMLGNINWTCNRKASRNSAGLDADAEVAEHAEVRVALRGQEYAERRDKMVY